ncbi:MAG: FAD-dependent monooxygenase [Kofleriaceae bacterium]
MQILISGASFAGLASAFWMTQLGHTVTIVELAPDLRWGGTAVNIIGDTVDICRRMGILDAVEANRMHLCRLDIKAEDDSTIRSNPIEPSEHDIEIERNVLLRLLKSLVTSELVFGDTITALHQTGTGVDVTFAKSPARRFDLVLGCDGIHSTVRKLAFGHEAEYMHFLEQYFSITIVDKLLIDRDTISMFNVPGKAIMLNAYKANTDIIFSFVSEKELPYDHRDEAQQRRIIAEQFATVPWRARELLREIDHSTSFYFDKLCQIRMPQWSKGRVVLVGDAGYCASPAAGMGGSLALDGAAAFADAMREHADLSSAFASYDARLRPFVDEIQAQAVKTGLETLVPRTAEAIEARNTREQMF